MWGHYRGIPFGVIANALNLFGVSPFWQPVATGLILIVAVGFDGYSGRGEFASR
jgi:ribose/xylose/arabinose/galactoside ABC-type transport system permease subunit